MCISWQFNQDVLTRETGFCPQCVRITFVILRYLWWKRFNCRDERSKRGNNDLKQTLQQRLSSFVVPLVSPPPPSFHIGVERIFALRCHTVASCGGRFAAIASLIFRGRHGLGVQFEQFFICFSLSFCSSYYAVVHHPSPPLT